MDPDVCRWILEFLLRKPIPDHVIREALFSMSSLPNHDSRFKKTLILRSIQCQAKDSCSVSEAVLEKLELVEELDCIEKIAITESMKDAYCAVAVWCTLKHEGECFDAVKRIWRGKVEKLEGKCGLYSNELRKWGDEIEAAVLDQNSWSSLLEKKRSAGEIALRSLKSYLEEAWVIMGPSFLESVAKTVTVMQGSGTGNEQAGSSMGVRPASELDLAAQMVNPGDPKVHDKVEERAASGVVELDLGGNDGDRVELGVQMMNQGEVKGLGDQDLGELATKAMDQEQVQGLIDKDAARRRRVGKGVEIVDVDENAGEMVVEPPRKKHAARRNRYDAIPSPVVRQLREALRSSNLEFRAFPSALRVSENVRREIQRKNMNVGPSVERVVEPGQASEANAAKPSLMGRNSTARTYRWEDSDCDSLEAIKKITLPTPKRIHCSPLKIYDMKIPKMRRIVKSWTTAEEEALRTAVDLLGRVNWKCMLNNFRHIFKGRTSIDLKDKWRNMTR